MNTIPTIKVDQLQTGDLIGVKTPLSVSPMSWLSLAIREVAKIEYNHMMVVVKNWDKITINEAIGRGVLPTVAEHRLKPNIDYLVLRPKNPVLSERDFALRANEILTYTGYDFKGLFIDQLTLQLFHKWKGRTGDDAMKKMYCYEYAAYCYKELYPEWWQIDPKFMLTDDRFTHYKLIM